MRGKSGDSIERLVFGRTLCADWKRQDFQDSRPLRVEMKERLCLRTRDKDISNPSSEHIKDSQLAYRELGGPMIFGFVYNYSNFFRIGGSEEDFKVS